MDHVISSCIPQMTKNQRGELSSLSSFWLEICFRMGQLLMSALRCSPREVLPKGDLGLHPKTFHLSLNPFCLWGWLSLLLVPITLQLAGDGHLEAPLMVSCWDVSLSCLYWRPKEESAVVWLLSSRISSIEEKKIALQRVYPDLQHPRLL